LTAAQNSESSYIDKDKVRGSTVLGYTCVDLGADRIQAIGSVQVGSARYECSCYDLLIEKVVYEIHLSGGVPSRSVDPAIKRGVRDVVRSLPDVRELYQTVSSRTLNAKPGSPSIMYGTSA
jgi:hypothetical protein